MSDPKPYLPPGEKARLWRRSDRRYFDSAPRRHAELVVLFGLSGSMQYFLQGDILTMTARSVLFAYPGESHYLLSETRDYDMYVAVISGALIRPAPVHPPLSAGAGAGPRPTLRRLAKPDFDEVCGLSAQLASTGERDAFEMGLAWWLHRLWRHSLAPDRGQSRAVHPNVGLAVEMISEDPGIAIAEVARRTGMSGTRLGQVFRQQIGMTLSAFRTEKRFDLFERIRHQRPSASLLGAALDAGFGDYSTFYRSYRRRYGHAPGRGTSRKSGPRSRTSP